MADEALVFVRRGTDVLVLNGRGQTPLRLLEVSAAEVRGIRAIYDVRGPRVGSEPFEAG
jgi:hypothetical protein